MTRTEAGRGTAVSASGRNDELLLTKGTGGTGLPGPDEVAFDEVKRWVRSGSIVRHLLRHRGVRVRTHDLDTLYRPLATALVARLLSRRRSVLEDERGRSIELDRAALARLARAFLRDLRARRAVLRAARAEVRRLEGEVGVPRSYRPVDLAGSPVYVRSDLVFGQPSGGPVSHVAGVLNQLDRFTGPPILVTTDPIPTVRPAIETLLVRPDGRFRDFAELPILAFNGRLVQSARAALAGRRIAFVYQRYSVESWAGLRLARELGVPFVLEYNGSEVWINRMWGRRLRYEALADRIERLVARGADLVVVVSEPMRDELVRRGVDPARILVNPNGVDVERYSPAVDGSAVRRRLGLEDALVIGFVGTFGPFHGAEVLVDAFARLIARRPDLAGRARLLLVGDGRRMAATRTAVRTLGLGEHVVFTGTVKQEDAPAHIAAADIAVAPLVPNPDGSPFFGSAMKVFEYMAGGKAIVASAIGQVVDVLEHRETGWLVPPAEPGALAEALAALADDPEQRARLGAAARERALARHSWEDHTRRIIDALRDRVAQAPG